MLDGLKIGVVGEAGRALSRQISALRIGAGLFRPFEAVEVSLPRPLTFSPATAN